MTIVCSMFQWKFCGYPDKICSCNPFVSSQLENHPHRPFCFSGKLSARPNSQGRPQVTTTSTRLWRPAVLVKTRVWVGAQSRGLIKPGLGRSYLRIFNSQTTATEPQVSQALLVFIGGVNTQKQVIQIREPTEKPLKYCMLCIHPWMQHSDWSEKQASCTSLFYKKHHSTLHHGYG